MIDDKIRDYILEHPDEPITLEVLSKAAFGHVNGKQSISNYLKQLRREGRLTRTKIIDGKKGLRYAYRWHKEKIVDSTRSNGPVITRTLNPELRPDLNKEALSSTLNDLEVVKAIIVQAKEWAWSRNSDSLRAFIIEIESPIKLNKEEW